MKRSREGMGDSQVTDQVPPGMADATADISDEAIDGVEGGDDASYQTDTEIDDQVSELQRELTTERDKHLRLAAEFDNFRRRNLKEKMEAESRGQAELARMILDPLDDIARFAHVDPAVTESKTVVEGVEMVEKKLDKLLRGVGLEPVNPVDQRFDPALHEAVSTETADSPDLDGTVSRVYQLGYTFKGQLLRPARVVVRQHHD
ncbi:MAG TPA: nucleotide exchange factor GrpE [Gemmatimonadaceae bacterium]|nr:nucleotide exchange factor GrpE [Gemmatimonadaceae bacterium]